MPAPVITAESDLTYQPPAETPIEEQQAFDQSLKDVISEIDGEYQEKPEFTDEELAQPAEGAEGEPEPAVEPTPEVEDAEDPAVARGMERLVSREVALQAKEQAFQARESRVSSLEQELTKLRAAMPQATVTENLHHSPSEAIKALGHDPETVVRLMIAEQLEAKGQEVPAALKEFVKDAKNNRRVAQLERQLAEKSRNEENAAFFNAVALGAREYVTKVDSKKQPTLANIAKTNPDRAHREIMEEISKDARSRMAADPNGQPITYQEAAERVEARLAELRTLLSPVPASIDPKKPVAGLKQTPPNQKPPVKPLKPWEKKGDDVFAQGLAEAEREFHRLEAQARARR